MLGFFFCYNLKVMKELEKCRLVLKNYIKTNPEKVKKDLKELRKLENKKPFLIPN